MEALPTELDVKILGYVRQGDYSAMVDMERVTRVSKYYRNIGQPLLYQRVTLYHDEADRIKLLLMTLLGRKDLRKHLHHLRILHCDTPQGGVIARDNEFVNLPYDHTQGDVFYERLASHLTNIKTTIDEIAIPYMSAQIRMIWVSKVLQPFPGFDGALALIIGMAKNIVAVELELAGKHSLTTALDFLRLQGQHPVRTLQKLESVRLNGAPRDFSITMLPDQKDMRVKANVDMYDNRADIGLRGLQTPRSPYGAPSLLATLHLRNVTFDPRDLEPLIRSKWLRNIKTLAITGLPSSWSTYNYTYLTTLPMQTRDLPIRSFFPPHLSTFELGEVGWDTITRFYVYASMDMRSYILYMLTELACGLPIKELTVTLGIPGLSDTYFEEVLSYLRRMADELWAVGVLFTVVYESFILGRETETLVRSRFTADLEERWEEIWRDRNERAGDSGWL